MSEPSAPVVLSTPAAIALALGVMGGALIAVDIPLVFLLCLCALALVLPKAPVVIVAATLLATSLSAHAWHELDRPLPTTVEGVAQVVGDGERINGAVRAEVSYDGRRYQVWARDDRAQVLADRSVGEHVEITGTPVPLSGLATPSLRRKHVAGRIDLTHITYVDSGNIHARIANRLRHLVITGAYPMEDDDSALYAGLVLGDDRMQQESQQEAFRESGLAHLLAVSGQNVAFLLLLLQPLIRRFSVTGRVVTSLSVLVMFGAITRWEPSVVRAVTMASVVLLAVWLGRRISPWRTLALAVTVCVLLDPFLAGSIGFLLSVTACCGMVLFGQPLSRRIPGPRAVRIALGFTMAAQIGVAPVQIAVFGDMPVVAVLTNLVAGPLAAFTMMWGMTAGLVAGAYGGVVSELLHIPTTIAVSALDWVATTGAGAPAGSWSAVGAAMIAAAFLLLPVRHPDGKDTRHSQVRSQGGSSSICLSGQGR